MKIGVSTASLYPLHIEDAFGKLAELGISSAEVFANSIREAEEPIISEICGMRERYGMTVTSFHPFSSPMESVFLFSTYDRRIEEMIEMYRGFFRSMNKLGAKIFVVHGAISSSKCTHEHYVRQFKTLSEAGREYGITVAQENVQYCMSGKLEFLKMMKRELPSENAKFVLDLKQVRRSGENPFDYIDALGESIVHCHVSDGNGDFDCLPVGKGTFDFPLFVRKMQSLGFDGAFIVELYRDNYGGFEELKQSADVLSELVDKYSQ